MKFMDIYSSYTENNLGETLYQRVLKHEPHKIIEFGTLNGYSAIHMGRALKELGRGVLFTYDLYDDFQYNHGNISTVTDNIKKHGLEDYVIPAKMNINKWYEFDDKFDMCHVDIANNGDIIETFLTNADNGFNKNAVCLFEGGSVERDNVEWMLKYNKPPINPVIKRNSGKVINEKFPSISEVIL